MHTLEIDLSVSSNDWRLSNLSVSGFSSSESGMDVVKGEYLGKGVVRLFRGEDSKEEVGVDDNESVPSLIVAILAAPGYMSASDFLGFIGQHSCEKDISHIRIIKSSRETNRHMVLIKFREIERSVEFVNVYSGKVFNGMDPETCLCLFIHDIVVSGNVVTTNFPYLLLDPFTSHKPQNKPFPPPTPDLKELPTCPVCLERMDSATTGLATILCEHTFHCHCLSKWAGGNCPVCRYAGKKNPENSIFCQTCGNSENIWICLICGNMGCGRYALGHAHAHFEATGHGYAMEMSTQRVWDYVSDGYVHRLIQSEVGKLVELDEGGSGGGGKFVYDDGKKGDFEQLALEYTALLTSQLDSQREYYEGLMESLRLQLDERLQLNERLELKKGEAVRPEIDEIAAMSSQCGKLKECGQKSIELGGGEKKGETLRPQLDDRLEQDEGNNGQHRMDLHMESLQQEIKLLSSRLEERERQEKLRAEVEEKQREEKRQKERQEKDLKQEIEGLRQETEKLSQLSKSFRQSLQDEKAISAAMMAKVKKLQEDKLAKENQIKDLEEQLRDVMFFLEAREKLKDADEDVKEGTLVMKKKGRRR